MSFVTKKTAFVRTSTLIVTLSAAMGCTQGVSNQFKALETVDSDQAGSVAVQLKEEKHSTKVDVLWVIDNSDSMKPSQVKLKNGLAQFAKKYLLKSGTDIQIGVITTDAFIANEAWEKYLITQLPDSKKTPLQFRAEAIASQRAEAPGARQWGPNYAKLTSDSLMRTKGTSLGALTATFRNRVSVGTKGLYEEHGFSSVSQFLADNEKETAPNKLFRKNSQRIIIFLSDEEDQSIASENVGPEPRKLLYRGTYYTDKDAAAAAKILPAQFSIDCQGSTVDGVALAPMNLCTRPGLVIGVDRFKASLDTFFKELDGSPMSNPNYFVTAIVAKDLSTIQSLRAVSTEKDSKGQPVITHERGNRYLELVSLVGNGSVAMDIGAENYAPILDQIGLEIVNRSVETVFKAQSKFTLVRAPDHREKIEATLVKASGERFILTSDQYQFVASPKGVKNILEITDTKLISALQAGDKVSVKYRPGTILPAQ